MGPEGAAEILFKEEIEKAENKDEVRERKVREYLEKFANPYDLASNHVDDIIDPKFTRVKLLSSLRILESKKKKIPQKKHSCIPM